MSQLQVTNAGRLERSAQLSECGTYRWTLRRLWGEGQVLTVCMFNPSEADHEIDDRTITLLMQLASNNGYGGILVVNGIPLRSSKPAEALAMLRWDETQDWHARDRLQDNLALINAICSKPYPKGRDVLLAWGALADRAADWFDHVREEIECALPEGGRLLCLGKTKGGHPIHPLARGKHRIRPDARFIPWAA
jgi:hypothetical protein